MVTKLLGARADLNVQYQPLRRRILEYVQVLDLLGRTTTAETLRIPPRLGLWRKDRGRWPWLESTSERVLRECPELKPLVTQIEQLLAERTPERIAASGYTVKGRPKVQTNLGYWPPRYS